MKHVLNCVFVCFLFTSAAARGEPSPRLALLDNGTIRLGVDLDRGGAITWLSRSGDENNVVNSFDYGRQIQMSFYSGPVPLVVGDKRPAPHWEHIGWNPIQTGDDFGHASRVLEHRHDGRELYVRCVPMQWPLDDVPGECTFECWITLDGPAAQVRARLNNARRDTTQYPARMQELPAVYTNGPLYRLMSYTGDAPFTGGPLSRIEKPAGSPGPWTSWQATEHWSALVRDDGWGLGVWHPGCQLFSGGFAGQPGAGGPRDNPTGYLSPNHAEILDHNIVYEYRYVLVLGSLEQIRDYVYAHAEKRAPRPDDRFDRDRQHWRWTNARDAGWPLHGDWHLMLEADDPQLLGPDTCWPAADVRHLHFEAACQASNGRAQLFWKTYAEPHFAEERSLTFDLPCDGQWHTTTVDVASHPQWRGTITGLRWDPVPGGRPGDWVRLRRLWGD